jgi:hypothetical protein
MESPVSGPRLQVSEAPIRSSAAGPTGERKASVNKARAEPEDNDRVTSRRHPASMYCPVRPHPPKPIRQKSEGNFFHYIWPEQMRDAERRDNKKAKNRDTTSQRATKRRRKRVSTSTTIPVPSAPLGKESRVSDPAQPILTIDLQSPSQEQKKSDEQTQEPAAKTSPWTEPPTTPPGEEARPRPPSQRRSNIYELLN